MSSNVQDSKVCAVHKPGLLDALNNAIERRPKFAAGVDDINMVDGGFDWLAYIAVGEAFERGVDRAEAVQVLINIVRAIGGGDEMKENHLHVLARAEALLNGEVTIPHRSPSYYEVRGMIEDHRCPEEPHGLDQSCAEVLNAAFWFASTESDEEPCGLREACEHAAWWIVRMEYCEHLDPKKARDVAKTVFTAIQHDFDALPGGCETWSHEKDMERYRAQRELGQAAE